MKNASYDFSLVCSLISRCNQLYETKLKNVNIIKRMKGDLDNFKSTTLIEAKNVFFDEISQFFRNSSSFSELGEENTSEDSNKKLVKLFYDILSINAYQVDEATKNINDHIKEDSKKLKLSIMDEVYKNQKIDYIENELKKLIQPVSNLEKIFIRVGELLAMQHQRLRARRNYTNSSSSITLVEKLKALNDTDYSMKRSLLSEIERILNTAFSDDIRHTDILRLTQLGKELMEFFQTNIFDALLLKLSPELQKELNSREDFHRGGIRGVEMLLSELTRSWIQSYQSHVTFVLKEKMKDEIWQPAELEDHLIEKLNYLHFLEERPDDYLGDDFLIIKKQLHWGDKYYFLTDSFLYLIQETFTFFEMIFEHKLLQYQTMENLQEIGMVLL